MSGDARCELRAQVASESESEFESESEVATVECSMMIADDADDYDDYDGVWWMVDGKWWW